MGGYPFLLLSLPRVGFLASFLPFYTPFGRLEGLFSPVFPHIWKAGGPLFTRFLLFPGRLEGLFSPVFPPFLGGWRTSFHQVSSFLGGWEALFSPYFPNLGGGEALSCPTVKRGRGEGSLSSPTVKREQGGKGASLRRGFS